MRSIHFSPQYYPYRFYPTYQRGAYLIPGKFTTQLYEAVVSEPLRQQSLPALPFDDVYITGILAAKSAIPRAHFEGVVLITDKNVNDTRAISDYTVHFNSLCPLKLQKYWNLFGEN